MEKSKLKQIVSLLIFASAGSLAVSLITGDMVTLALSAVAGAALALYYDFELREHD